MNGYQHKFVIQANNPEDWLFDLSDGGETVHQFTWPVGPYEKNECSDTIYHAGEQVGYHEHRKGIETFLIANGSVDVTIRGKHTIAKCGDIIFLAPYTSHAFTYLEEGTIWRECFQEINMSGGIINKHTVKKNYGDLYFDPEFRPRYLAATKNMERLPPVNVTEVTREELPEIRTPEFGFSTFHYDGIELRQKVGRWETNGVREVWQAILKKGVRIAWNDPYGEPEVYLVSKGSIRLSVMDQEYVVGKDTFINIPPYVKREIEVLSDNTEIFDLGCSACMLEMQEDMASAKVNQPELLKDAAAKKAFMQKYGCYITEIEYR